MPTRQLGRTGIFLKPIAYGAMHLSIEADKRPSEAESVRLLQRIVDELGIDFIDTADAYCIDDTETGHNERLIAKALDGERRARAGLGCGEVGSAVAHDGAAWKEFQRRRIGRGFGLDEHGN